MSETILANLHTRLQSAKDAVVKDLSTVRTGRAKPSLVEDVKVEAYGTIMTIKELATISAPDTTLLVISPWDRSLVAAIAAGINKAGLNIQPVVDGESVKIAIPALNEERRLELVKLVHQKIESGKVLVRQIRTEVKAEIEAQEGESGVSEDNIKTWLAEMQKQIDAMVLALEELGKEKEKELMTL
jgi:ribosome recycling factor